MSCHEYPRYPRYTNKKMNPRKDVSKTTLIKKHRYPESIQAFSSHTPSLVKIVSKCRRYKGHKTPKKNIKPPTCLNTNMVVLLFLLKVQSLNSPRYPYPYPQRTRLVAAAAGRKGTPTPPPS